MKVASFCFGLVFFSVSLGCLVCEISGIKFKHEFFRLK